MSLRLRYTDAARRELLALPGNYRQRLKRIIEDLASRPIPPEAKPLRERPGRFRIRIDRWRLIYRFDPGEGVVLILRVRLKTGPEIYEGID